MCSNCPACGLSYKPETGFYYGAMYISYGLSTVLVLIVRVLLYYLACDPAVWVYITTASIVIVLFTPLLFRYSRAIMLYLFGGVGYDPQFIVD